MATKKDDIAMEIIDSQVHIWTPDRPDRPWKSGAVPHLDQPIGYEDLLPRMVEAGVDRAILVPPGWEGDRVDYCLEAAGKYPQKFAVMGRIDLRAPDAAQIESWLDQPGMLGMRLTFQGEESRFWLTDGTADWFWPAAERARIPVMVNAPYNIPEVGEIARRHPGLTLVIDHMGVRQKKDHDIAQAIAATVGLAQYPNVAVKLSLVPTFSSAPYPYSNIHPYVRSLVEAYGARRCFWGSDLSVMFIRSSCTYAQSVDLFRRDMPFLSQDDIDWIMGRGLRTCLGWPSVA